MAYEFPKMLLHNLAARRVRVRFTVEQAVGTNSGTEYDDGTTSSSYISYYDNDVDDVGISRSDAFFTYDTSMIPSSATITAAIVRYRTAGTVIGGGTPTNEINVKMKNSAGMGYGSGNLIDGPKTITGNTAYTYTLSAGEYANIGKGSGAKTCVVLANISSGSSGDNITQPFTATSTELEVEWTQ